MNRNRIEEFSAYLDREVANAVKELGQLPEQSRKHLQKLVYTNLVDRFDSMVDHILLENCRHKTLLDESLQKLKDPLPEGEILRLLIDTQGFDSHLDETLRETLRNGVLRNRHSRKLNRLLEVFAPKEKLRSPRVNPSTGKILGSYTQHNKSIPSSIPGYADWLYSRRNAVVHGGGSSNMLQNDLKQIKDIYNCDVGKSVKLKLGSITTASTFYKSVVSLL